MTVKLPKKEFDYIYSKVPRLCVEVVIINNAGVLLTKRNISPGKNLWHLPGGTVLYGESLKQTVKRVAVDELGVSVKILKSLPPNEWSGKDNIFLHAVTIPYLVKITKGQIKLNHQASEYGFFKKIPQNSIKEHQRYLQRMKLNGQFV